MTATPSRLRSAGDPDRLNDAVAELLRKAQTPGDFFAAGVCALRLPLIEVDGVGPVALPLLPVQAAQLVAAAERAPYGRGGDTLVDTAVRRTWQIGADRVHIAGAQWAAMLAGVVQRAAAGLGAGTGVAAELYKLLVYDEGSFFVSHRDTEKSAGMFATLIVSLPSPHAGGELVVRHGTREERLALRTDDPSEAAWAAFYADCLHEVLPVTAGCRLVLVYNLLHKGRGARPRPPLYEREAKALGTWLRRWAAGGSDGPHKLVYPLEHAYTPAGLSFAALKGADAAAAALLAGAARDAGCELHVALMRIEESGAADETGYARSSRYRRHEDDDDGDDDDDDGFTVAEVFDRSLTLSSWSATDGRPAALGTMPFLDAEVCPADALDDMEADETHFEEATGNEGASFERSYQRAALVLWPHARRLELLAQAGLGVALPALADQVARWADAGGEPGDPQWLEAHELALRMLRAWSAPEDAGAADEPGAVAAVLQQLVRLRDVEAIEALMAGVVGRGHYGTGDNAAIVAALKLLPAAHAAALLQAAVQANAGLHIGGCADLLLRAGAVPAWRRGLQGAAEALLAAMPGDPAQPRPQADAWRRERADAAVVHDALRALLAIDADLADRAVGHWLAWPQAFGLDAVIVPALRRLCGGPALLREPAAQRLRAAVLAHLQARTAQDLAPPADWQREADLRCRCEHCRALGLFLRDGAQPVWRFKAREDNRRHVEESIRQAACDVDCTTERKGSPHVLVCIKNRASYERRVRQRRADLDDLKRFGA
ncbi:MAG: 2OG-Fe(II) oxygenase [Rubrivivax sp.]